MYIVHYELSVPLHRNSVTSMTSYYVYIHNGIGYQPCWFIENKGCKILINVIYLDVSQQLILYTVGKCIACNIYTSCVCGHDSVSQLTLHTDNDWNDSTIIMKVMICKHV